MTGRICDELPFGFGWIAARPAYMQRASHALVHEGRVWIVDPVDVEGLDPLIRSLGEPAGVIQLLDRHARDGVELASRYGVPHHVARSDGVAGSPFEIVSVVDVPGWRETALWWEARRTLVVADALGAAGYFLAPGERLAVHPMLRLLPPGSLGRFRPEHVLLGHGAGVHGRDAAAALAAALGTSRRRIPRWLAGFVRRAARARAG